MLADVEPAKTNRAARVAVGGAIPDAAVPGAKSAVARLVRTRAEERSWLIAAAGEGRTADRLDRFAQVDPRWRVLHGVGRGGPVPGIDHLAIGPGGVFVISSKRHPRARVWVRGNVLVVNGETQPYVRAARHDAMQVAATLSAATGSAVAVGSVVTLVDADDLTVTVAPPDVSVLHQRGLVHWLLRQPEVLKDGRLEAVQEIAERPSTWMMPQA